MMNEAKWEELRQEEEMAYFRADVCPYSPESYTLEEKRDICNEMMGATKAGLDAMREDFEQPPPDARAKLLDMLCQSGVESPQWWWDVLVGDGDPPTASLSPPSAEVPRCRSLRRTRVPFRPIGALRDLVVLPDLCCEGVRLDLHGRPA